VTASIAELKGMTHTQLKAWATANEMEHKTAFTRFKQALAANGINYDRLIVLAHADKTARLEVNATASLTLYCDAKAKNDRFTIRRRQERFLICCEALEPRTLLPDHGGVGFWLNQLTPA